MSPFSRRALFGLTALSMLVLGAQPALAEGAATASVRKANQTLSDLLRKKAAPGSAEEKALTQEVTNRLSSFLDVDELGRRALKDHWSKLSDEQKKEFSKLLRELVEANYVKALRSQLEYEVKYVGEAPKDSGVSVATEVRSTKSGRKQSMSIDYVLHENASAWRVFDLVTDGVGLVENYRSQFNKIIAKEGVTGLLDRMRKKKGASAPAT
ncbi:MAG TPA: ABC transporter substrate-binding protein [Polyangiaceae bacterium]|nr:ABC transporter substrate-binding protein [Polyangiaceae bacterium]